MRRHQGRTTSINNFQMSLAPAIIKAVTRAHSLAFVEKKSEERVQREQVRLYIQGGQNIQEML